MNSPIAFRATYADWKLIKTRGVVQIVMEVPLADSGAAYDVLGGMPNYANETWFAIAPLKTEKPEKEKRDWRELQPAQQAGIRCGDPVFTAFLKEQRGDDWAEVTNAADCVRLICDVQSRAELSTNQKARVIWHQLDTQFQGWLALERVQA